MKAVESEGATLLAMYLASLFDDENPAAKKLCRLVAAVSKFHICKRVPSIAYEAMECFGGNGFPFPFVYSRAGYIEESPMPYLYRQAPLNAIWEGSGNVICLDVSRSATVEPEYV
jgi:putative acyl-CoA dehydrogenase